MTILSSSLKVAHWVTIWAICNRLLSGSVNTIATIAIDFLLVILIAYLDQRLTSGWTKLRILLDSCLVGSLFDNEYYPVSYLYLLNYVSIYYQLKYFEQGLDGSMIRRGLQLTLMQAIGLKILGQDHVWNLIPEDIKSNIQLLQVNRTIFYPVLLLANCLIVLICKLKPGSPKTASLQKEQKKPQIKSEISSSSIIGEGRGKKKRR